MSKYNLRADLNLGDLANGALITPCRNETSFLELSLGDHLLLEYVHYLQNIPFWPLKFSHFSLAVKLFSFRMLANTVVITIIKILLCMNYKY